MQCVWMLEVTMQCVCVRGNHALCVIGEDLPP